MTQSHADGGATLVLGADGPGLPDQPESGLGMKLIDLPCRQMDAEAAWQSGAGTRLTVRFPIKVA